MNARTSVSALIVALSLAALPGFASASMLRGHEVNAQQIDAIKTGETLDALVKTVGQPESITTWADGSRSAVYTTSDNLVGAQRVYVDLDSGNHVKQVQVIAE